MIIRRWEGCYNASWKGLITPASFTHPAKFSRGLIERIYNHCLDKEYLKQGDVVGDPFAGIGSGGVTAAFRELLWIGVELEPRFVEMAKSNFELHARNWRDLGYGRATIIQGDSRQFHKIVHCAAVLTSPPYADSFRGQKSGIDQSKMQRENGPNGQSMHHTEYGETPGQIGALKPGSVDAVVTSPPFTQGSAGGGGINVKGYGVDGKDKVGNRTYQGRGAERSTGNIETLKEGTVDAVVSSPPYEETLNHGGGPDTKQDLIKGGKSLLGIKDGYGASKGQIGKEKGETYWEAVDQVYRSCFQSIKPSGYLILVVKDYVKKGKRVLLCDDTCRVLEHIGFTMVERIHAMLVEQIKHNDLFEGVTTTTKSRKSFFRRLAENKGSPAIDYEEVLIARRP